VQGEYEYAIDQLHRAEEHAMKLIFWLCFFGVFYAYFGYPILLMILGKLKDIFSPTLEYQIDAAQAPSVTIIIPAHNEEAVIARKLENTQAIEYPGELKILIVSDGSTDATVDIVQQAASSDSRIVLYELEERRGKAQALNHAIKTVATDLIVFSDASIILEQDSLWNIVQPFADPKIGCVSGEDIIEGGGGEGLYGKYELFLRDRESRVGSIVGASGSFYAQRTHLVTPFEEGLAPDFLSVMNTVESGYRVISYPPAVGYMSAVESHKDEFQRKIRTLIRGMTALFRKADMLNPLKYPMFSLFLWSHKLMRWLVPFFLIGMLISNLFMTAEVFYMLIMFLQLAFYSLALLGYLEFKSLSNTLPGKIALYFTGVNVAILVAWIRYVSGVRQEIWTPSKRT
jgi:cellulose synthase/poly-beta-1,6-N-acetylglucosamine synthase-like glycosyltransferase